MYIERWSDDAAGDAESFSSVTPPDKHGRNAETGHFVAGETDDRFPDVDDILDRLSQKTKVV
ncbi:hypothetical protein [Yoonia sp.]|uniref:hypothetical protein n=1 Tax=Yoonia sp. TaxID=2212373 RepID=UPI003F6C1970